MEQTNNTKICEKCKKFKPFIARHTLCYSCWYDAQRKCKSCGDVIIKLPKNYFFCNKCFFTKALKKDY